MGGEVGRIAPTPTGFLHLGHARTFGLAHARMRARGGRVLLRIDDIDAARCREEYVRAACEDLRWLGLDWDGPMVRQGSRVDRYAAGLEELKAAGRVYPCWCSRRDVQRAMEAPHEAGYGVGGDGEVIYPGTCRPPRVGAPPAGRPHWRFCVPDGRDVVVRDERLGAVTLRAGRDFGDFIVWRSDGVPGYQLASVVDDVDFGVTEIVRGMDLLVSSARQVLLFEALGAAVPRFFHAELLADGEGMRLAKRSDSLGVRALREAGRTPAQVLQEAEQQPRVGPPPGVPGGR
jgi:glutamyl-tRNA synthetase